MYYSLKSYALWDTARGAEVVRIYRQHISSQDGTPIQESTLITPGVYVPPAIDGLQTGLENTLDLSPKPLALRNTMNLKPLPRVSKK